MPKAPRWSRRQVLASLGASAALSPFLPLLNSTSHERDDRQFITGSLRTPNQLLGFV